MLFNLDVHSFLKQEMGFAKIRNNSGGSMDLTLDLTGVVVCDDDATTTNNKKNNKN